MNVPTRLPFLRQPIVHFLILGAIIMALDFAAFGRPEDPRRIVLNDEVYTQIAGVYRDNIGKVPTPEEMEPLTRLWLQNEMIYREARIMGLDKGDEAIRSRLNLKLRDALANQAVVNKPDEANLRRWFEENRAAYDRPATYSFRQAFIGDEAEASALAAALSAGDADALERFEDEALAYPARPKVALDAAFGEDDADLLVTSVGAWVAVDSPRGWHVAQVTGALPPESVTFESVRGRAGEDYKRLERERLLLSMYDEIAAKFEVIVDLETPPEQWDEQTFDNVRLSDAARSKAKNSRFEL